MSISPGDLLDEWRRNGPELLSGTKPKLELGTFVRTMDLKTNKISPINETRALPVRVGTGAERTTKLLAQLLAVSVRRVPLCVSFR